MNRRNMTRRIVLFLALGAWGFLLVSMASFHPEDWPSHQVYPYSPIKNLCGPAGAYVAYHLFFAIGQGVFPILMFSGLCLALLLFHNKISDLWLRGIGLAVLSIAFAALVHLIRPGSSESFPEGHGGIVGISATAFLKSHFNTAVHWTDHAGRAAEYSAVQVPLSSAAEISIAAGICYAGCEAAC